MLGLGFGFGSELGLGLGLGLGLESGLGLGSHLGVDDVGQAVALLDHLLRVQVRLALRVVLVRLCRSSAQHAVSAARRRARCGAALQRARRGDSGAATRVSARAGEMACGGGLRTRHHSYEMKVPPGLRHRMISR